MKVGKYADRPCPTCGAPRSIVNGDWLREQRERARLTLREVARRLGFSAPYISDIELGRRNCTPAILEFYEQLSAEIKR